MFAENLRTLRKAKGLSQQELAIRLNVVRQTISKWEKGLSVPDADLLIKVAEVLVLFRCIDTALADTIDGELRIGRYYSEDGMSWVHIADSSFFQFNRHSTMNYMPNGEFSVSDEKLILKAGENEEYVFIIKDNGLVLELESTHIEGILEQGMLFVYSDGLGYEQEHLR